MTMPVFVIKAKDALAVEAVEAYMALCIRHELHDQADQVELARDEIAEWQLVNQSQVRMPDHKHVPAAGKEQP